MTVRAEAKKPTSLGMGPRTMFFFIGVAVLAVAAITAFLMFAPAPGIASSGDAQRSVEADSARWEAMAAYYAAQAQAKPHTMSAYDAVNTARELRNPALATILSTQAQAEPRVVSAYETFITARALRNAAPAAHTGGSKEIGSPALDVSGGGCRYDNGSRVFVCGS